MAWLTVDYQALLQPQLSMQVTEVRSREITTCCSCIYQTLCIVRAARVSALTCVGRQGHCGALLFLWLVIKLGGRCFSFASWPTTSLKDLAKSSTSGQWPRKQGGPATNTQSNYQPLCFTQVGLFLSLRTQMTPCVLIDAFSFTSSAHSASAEARATPS